MDCKLNKRKRPKSSRNGKTTLEKGETNPADDSLHYIVMDLLGFFNEFQCLCETKEQIENKFPMVENECWSIDRIKNILKEAQTMDMKSNVRKHWSYVLVLQVMKTLYYEYTKHAPEQISITGQEQASGSQHSTCNESDDVCEYPSKKKKIQRKEDGTGKTVDSTKSQTVYIKIPLSKLSYNESASSVTDQYVSSPYKLIDGYPSDRPTDIRGKKDYVMSYNNKTKNADWVYEILNRSTLAVNHTVDISFGTCMLNRGYDQGHLAAAANHRWCHDAYNGTYLFSNISPQIKSLNNGLWKTLENYCQEKINKDREKKIRNVHVYTGPVYVDEDEGKGKRKKRKEGSGSKNRKVVPTGFFKVIIVENIDGTVLKPECYLIPNDKSSSEDKKVMNDAKIMNKNCLQGFNMRIDLIESKSGLKFTAKSCKQGETDSINTVTWMGEDGNGESQKAEIKVRISKPRT